MDKRLKQRLIGAAVLIALAVIFIPMLFKNHGSGTVSMKIKLPPEPDYHFTNKVPQPIGSQGGQPSSGTITDIPNMTTVSPIGQVTPPSKTVPGSTTVASPARVKLSASPAITQPKKSGPIPEELKAVPPPSNVMTPAGKPVVSAWVIQVISLVDQHGAVALRDRLRKAGFAAYVDRARIHGRTYYRVRVGPRLSHSKAEQVVEKIQQAVRLKGILVPYQ